MFDLKNKITIFGFTLAEVLITLAIVGSIAALTLHNLLDNFEKRQLAAQLVKTHAEIVEGLQVLMIRGNTSQLSLSEPWINMNGDCDEDTLGTSSNNCDTFSTELLSVFSGSTVGTLENFSYKEPIKTLDGNTFETPNKDKHAIKLLRGSVLYKPTFYRYSIPSSHMNEVKRNGGAMSHKVGEFYIDVNGSKRPNTLGYDIFKFNLSDNGFIYPTGSKDYSLYETGNNNTNYWKDATTREYSCQKGTSSGEGCGARALEENTIRY